MSATSNWSTSRAIIDRVLSRTVRAVVTDPRTTPAALAVLAAALLEGAREAEEAGDVITAANMRLIAALILEMVADEERAATQAAPTSSGTEG